MTIKCIGLEDVAFKVDFQKDLFGESFIYFCTLKGIVKRPSICTGNNCEYLARLYADAIIPEKEYETKTHL